MANYKKEALFREQDLRSLQSLDDLSLGQIIKKFISIRLDNDSLENEKNSLILYIVNSLLNTCEVNDKLYEQRIEERKKWYRNKKKDTQ